MMKLFLESEYREISVCVLGVNLWNGVDLYFSYSLSRLLSVEKTPSATVSISFEYRSLQISEFLIFNFLCLKY